MANLKRTAIKLPNGNTYEFIPPSPTETERGGIIATLKSENDTVEVKLGLDGKLYVPKYPELDPTTFDSLTELLNTHVDNTSIHVTSEEKNSWNNKLDNTEIADWAKQSEKPLYTADEVGAEVAGAAQIALESANTYTDEKVAQKSQVQLINTNETENVTEILSTLKIHRMSKEKYNEELANGNIDEDALYLTPDEDIDLSGYVTVDQLNGKADAEHTHKITDVENLQTTLDEMSDEAKSYTDSKTADLTSTTVVDNKITTHNTGNESHSDIRLLITNLTTRIDTILNSSDVDLDQLSELVAYIKSNRTLIEEVTTNKVNVSDIIDNLTTNVSDKPLSAAQAVVIKKLIDDLQLVVNGKADAEHTHDISDVTNLQSALDNKVSVDRTINNKPLTENVVLSASDVGADASGSADAALNQAKEYTNNAVSNMTTVQIITWEVDD